jgi:co-chaperonin GroES (HSP10)
MDDAPDQPWKDTPPTPLFNPSGKRVIVYQEPADRVSKGGIVIPKNSERAPTIGVVVKVGNGYDSDDPRWQAYEDGLVKEPPVWNSPFPVGSRVVWGKWHGDITLSIEIDPKWWDSKEEEDKYSGHLLFVVLHAKDVLGLAE